MKLTAKSISINVHFSKNTNLRNLLSHLMFVEGSLGRDELDIWRADLGHFRAWPHPWSKTCQLGWPSPIQWRDAMSGHQSKHVTAAAASIHCGSGVEESFCFSRIRFIFHLLWSGVEHLEQVVLSLDVLQSQPGSLNRVQGGVCAVRGIFIWTQAPVIRLQFKQQFKT